MQNARLYEAWVGIKINERNLNNLRYANDTTLMTESEEELKSLLMEVKEESEEVSLKLNIQKTNMAFTPITSMKLAEAPVLWPPDVKNWLIGKDPDAGKDWRQEEKGITEGEMVGWHHQLNWHEFEDMYRKVWFAAVYGSQRVRHDGTKTTYIFKLIFLLFLLEYAKSMLTP